MRSIQHRTSRWTSPNLLQELSESKSSQTSHRSMVADGRQSSLSILTTFPHHLHKMRRNPLNPLFSKRTVKEHAGSVQLCVTKLCARFDEFHVSQQPIGLQAAYSALTLDMITLYCLGRSYGSLEKADFDPQLGRCIASGGELRLLLKQFPWILKIFALLPSSIASRLNRNAVNMVNRRRVSLSSPRTNHGIVANRRHPW